jgi:hypothetical protein
MTRLVFVLHVVLVVIACGLVTCSDKVSPPKADKPSGGAPLGKKEAPVATKGKFPNPLAASNVAALKTGAKDATANLQGSVQNIGGALGGKFGVLAGGGMNKLAGGKLGALGNAVDMAAMMPDPKKMLRELMTFGETTPTKDKTTMESIRGAFKAISIKEDVVHSDTHIIGIISSTFAHAETIRCHLLSFITCFAMVRLRSRSGPTLSGLFNKKDNRKLVVTSNKQTKRSTRRLRCLESHKSPFDFPVSASGPSQ